MGTVKSEDGLGAAVVETEKYVETNKLLKEYNNNPSALPSELCEQIINEISKTGLSCYPWHLLKTVLARKLDEVIEAYPCVNTSNHKTLRQTKGTLRDKLLGFDEPPFTVQRLCEILLQPPNTQYRSREAAVSALGKVLQVRSTVKTLPPVQYSQKIQHNHMIMTKLATEHASAPFLPPEMRQDFDFFTKERQRFLEGGPKFRAAFVPRLHRKVDVVLAVLCYVGFFLCTIMLWNYLAVSGR